MNLPNKLTVFRMVLTPIFLFVFLFEGIPHHIFWGTVVFIIGSLTDFLDGHIARKYEMITVFGKLADPVADKMLTTAALLAFLEMNLCSVWIVMIILTREFLITSLRLVSTTQGVVIPANIFGKIKTASQMVFTIIIMLFIEAKAEFPFILEKIYPNGEFPLSVVSNVLLWITAVFAVVSGIIYLRKSLKLIDFTM
ncbi:MAG: CDP-diacylglycerol--glycerol-3-phosphate 3-phosphatidyltransferase [Ruminococcaceae bacterium]|nr:CDP-diacylglycerol--glycerol-3-phosphate 3-phosphatidyltransferase [Oscillospiraceae bacterium]